MLGGATLAFAGASLQDQRIREIETASPTATSSAGPLVAATPAATPDGRPPSIRVTQPAAGETIYTASVVLRGHTEAGADLDVLAESTNEHLPVEVDPDGRFAATIPLTVGHNWLTLTSHDPAGNAGQERVDLVRTASAASIELSVEPSNIDLASLPQQLQVGAAIKDDLGAPADGVPVTFSLSPPNSATMTYATTSSHGQASWPNLVINNNGLAGGQWLVTVLADLPTGNELSTQTSFNLR